FFGGPIGKSAQFPLQEWLPDAMAGPTSVSALIHAATMVKAGVFLVGRMGPIFYLALIQFGQVTPFFGTIAWIGAFTAFLAATQATVSREIKKVLAYSTVSQIGYMMLGLGIAGLSANFVAGYSAGLMQLMSHAVFKAALFLAAGWVIHATESRFMDQMGGLAKAMRLTSVSMLLAGLSLMGIPPFSGFWTKDAILSATFQSSQYLLYGIGLATVFLTAFYTTRMLGITFAGKTSSHVDELREEGKAPHEAGIIMLVPYFLLAIASLALGLLYPLYSRALTNYLTGTFQSLPSPIPGAAVSGFSTTDILLLTLSAGIAGVGLVIGYLRYFRRPYALPVKQGGLRGFLWHRWYIDAIYYRVFVNGITRASYAIYKFIEQGVWDRLSPSVARDIIDYTTASGKLDSGVVDGAVNDVASTGSRLSNILRRFQSGVTEQYVIVFAIGIVLLLAYMIFVIGAG
ncbi:MAG TPA: proton-conducting transporter membrane subunit, partial [Candidatus Bathyarchaeia archaeon]|nr:proton-conducting transporter membrane subunit [Candidatus Bathyarchaeia archaeon]